MSEIEKIYQCVFDKAYLNKVELSILLDSLSDRKLAKWFINSLCLSSNGYEVMNLIKENYCFYMSKNLVYQQQKI